MNRTYFNSVIFAALASVCLAAVYMWNEAYHPAPIPETIIPQPMPPFKSFISGVGIVEASSKNIFIGTPLNRVVADVKVKVGEKVKEGQVLFCLESRDLAADLLNQQMAYKNAEAKLHKLKALPRAEDVDLAAAFLEEAKIELAQAESLYHAVEGLQEDGAISQEEYKRRHFARELAHAKVQQARAKYKKTQYGAWGPDLEIAQLEVLQAEANVRRVETDIQRMVIRAPLDGTVLQLRINEGEFPPQDSSRTPAMIIGNTDPLHLRVSINQFDVSNFSPDSKAVAFLQGNAHQKFDLKFVYIEPYFVSKQNLTNEITEKVDTRVLQVIYCFTENDQRIFAGQQMDVFIETPPP